MSTIAELFELAVQHQQTGRVADAVRYYQQIVQADLRQPEAWHQLGCIATQVGQPDAAFEYLVRAIRLDGAQPRYHQNLGTCCRALGKLADAQTSYERAVQLDPNYLVARVNLCFVLYGRGLTAQAEACASELPQLERPSPEAHTLYATLLLLQGQYQQGWTEHEWRLKFTNQQPPRSAAPRWDGSPLEGGRIVIHAEQGLGDTLQFVRYAPLLRSRGLQPVLAVQKALTPLLKQAGLSPVVCIDDPWPAHDVQIAMLSLPWALGTTLDSVPNEVPYLRAAPSLVDHWRARLAPQRDFRVGICWQGNPAYNYDRTRSIPLGEFLPLAKIAGVSLISLQKGHGREQLASLRERFPVLDLDAELDEAQGPFMDTAAVMKNLDLVIASDTAAAHLAAALGVPVWVALSTTADWRWLLARDDSPWYPTMRLFRQSAAGDWTEVFRRMASELAARVSA